MVRWDPGVKARRVAFRVASSLKSDDYYFSGGAALKTGVSLAIAGLGREVELVWTKV